MMIGFAVVFRHKFGVIYDKEYLFQNSIQTANSKVTTIKYCLFKLFFTFFHLICNRDFESIFLPVTSINHSVSSCTIFQKYSYYIKVHCTIVFQAVADEFQDNFLPALLRGVRLRYLEGQSLVCCSNRLGSPSPTQLGPREQTGRRPA